MNNVYYGEYSLEYWLKMMLNKTIILPDYQRIYRWQEDDVQNLIKAFKLGSFVPPVTIGHYRDTQAGVQDLILDGQQRLTSLLLAYLGIFPLSDQDIDNAFPKFAYEDGEENIEDHEEERIKNKERFKNWRYPSLLRYGNTKKEIKKKALEENYKKLPLEISIDKNFLRNTYLGYSYIVPNFGITDSQKNEIEQTKYYARVFQSINSTGVSLEDQESRAATYYLDKSIKHYFAPNFAKESSVGRAGRQIDFVRALAFVSELASQESAKTFESKAKKVAIGFPRGNFESYYLKFINDSIIEHMRLKGERINHELGLDFVNKREYEFKSHDLNFWESDWKKRVDNFKKLLMELKGNLKFDSIIELDIYTFGLVYYTIMFDIAPDEKYVDSVRKEIKDYLGNEVDYNHKRNPNRITYIRERLSKSCSIYQKLFVTGQ